MTLRRMFIRAERDFCDGGTTGGTTGEKKREADKARQCEREKEIP